MNLKEARAQVIEDFIAFESLLDRLLSKAILGHDEYDHLLRGVILNTSIMQTGTKVAILVYLKGINPDWPSLDNSKLHQFLNIRNQFAHAQGSLKGIAINVKTDEKGNAIETEVEKKISLETVKQGKLKCDDYQNQLEKFKTLYTDVMNFVFTVLRDYPINREPIKIEG